MQETQIQYLHWEDPLEKKMATHSRGLENSMDRGAWQAIVHGVAESDTSEHACMPERPTGMQEWKIVKEKKKRYWTTLRIKIWLQSAKVYWMSMYKRASVLEKDAEAWLCPFRSLQAQPTICLFNAWTFLGRAKRDKSSWFKRNRGKKRMTSMETHSIKILWILVPPIFILKLSWLSLPPPEEHAAKLPI